MLKMYERIDGYRHKVSRERHRLYVLVAVMAGDLLHDILGNIDVFRRAPGWDAYLVVSGIFRDTKS